MTDLHLPRWCLLALLLSLAVGCAAPTSVRGNRYTLPQTPEAQRGCDPDAPARKWAVVVGVNFYQDRGIADLEGAVNDAWAFYHYMASPGGAAVPRSRMMLLLNDKATKPAVEGALGNFLVQACPQDQIIIYFAGHGVTEPENPDEGFLLVHDSKLNNLVGTAVSMNKLPDFLQWRASQTGDLLMIVDACHAGKLRFRAEGEEDTDNRGGRFETSAMVAKRIGHTNEGLEAIMEGRKGWGALSAAAGDQFAQEQTKKGWSTCTFGKVPYKGGLFTCHLLSGLSGRADEDQDGMITLKELRDHLAVTVPRDSLGAQLPKLSGDIPLTSVLAVNNSEATIDIPVVPERFRIEEAPDELDPYLYTGVALTGAALLNGLIFQLIANNGANELNVTTANNPAKDTRPEFEALRESQSRQQDTSTISYLAGASIGVLTLAVWAWDLLDDPQDIEDVYDLPPWFELNALPSGAAATITLSWD